MDQHFVSIIDGEKKSFTVKELTKLLSTLPEDTEVSIMGATYFGVFHDKENGYVLLDETNPD